MPDGNAASPATCSGALRVGGFVPFTLTDYPDALAAVVFCQGCPWHCGYCHNPHLIAARVTTSAISRASSIGSHASRTARRRRVLGRRAHGPAGARRSRRGGASQGFKIGLHTGGAYPRRLRIVLPLIDWVGIDVKAP